MKRAFVITSLVLAAHIITSPTLHIRTIEGKPYIEECVGANCTIDEQCGDFNSSTWELDSYNQDDPKEEMERKYWECKYCVENQ